MEEHKIDVITERLNNLIKNFSEEKGLALEWRNRFCKKIDIAIEKIETLPCGARIEITKALRSDVTWLQRIGSWALALVVSSLFTLGVGWGAINTQVGKDYDKLIVIEGRQTVVLQDLATIKEVIKHEHNKTTNKK